MGIEKKVDIKDNGFDMDIYEVKEALLLTRQYNPEDYASKDYYERRLLQLVEQQKAAQANDKRAKAKGEDEKMADNSKD
jgi:non-homologous end joining protein Ku